MFPGTQDDLRTAWLQRIGQVSPDDITAKAVEEEAEVAESVRHDVVLSNGLHGVDVPVHVVTGTVDALVPEVNGIRIARSIPDASLLELAESGYAAVVVDQSQFIAALTAPAK